MRSICIVLTIVFCASNVSAKWELLQTFNDPIGCGFFFNEQNGFIGTGSNFRSLSRPKIYRTTDGGVTWSSQMVPIIGVGAVSSIYMSDSLVGYASIFSDQHSLWKTTDGGARWFNVSPQGSLRGSCVEARGDLIVLTLWP